MASPASEPETELLIALGCLAQEFTSQPPPETLQLFPTWKTELPQVLRLDSAAQLQASLEGLEAKQEAQDPTEAIAFLFAKHALSAALEVHNGPYSSSPSAKSPDGVTTSTRQLHFSQVCLAPTCTALPQ